MKSLLHTSLTLALLSALFVPVSADVVSEALERGNGFFSTGQYEMAIFQYRVALASADDERAATLHYNLGVCHHNLNNPAEAVREYRSALSLRGGRYAKASYALGIALRSLQRPAEAETALRQAIQHAGGRFAAASWELGMLMVGERNYHAAADSFRQALRSGDLDASVLHNNLGVALAMTGDLNGALDEFRLALRRSEGKMSEAAHNQQICHRLIGSSTRQLLAELRLNREMSLR